MKTQTCPRLAAALHVHTSRPRTAATFSAMARIWSRYPCVDRCTSPETKKVGTSPLGVVRRLEVPGNHITWWLTASGFGSRLGLRLAWPRGRIPGSKPVLPLRSRRGRTRTGRNRSGRPPGRCPAPGRRSGRASTRSCSLDGPSTAAGSGRPPAGGARAGEICRWRRISATRGGFQAAGTLSDSSWALVPPRGNT